MHCVFMYFFMNHSSSNDSDLNSDPTGLEENTTMMSRQYHLPTSPCYTTNYWAANDRIRFPNSVPHSRHRLVVAEWQILALNPFIVICNSQTFRS